MHTKPVQNSQETTTARATVMKPRRNEAENMHTNLITYKCTFETEGLCMCQTVLLRGKNCDVKPLTTTMNFYALCDRLNDRHETFSSISLTLTFTVENKSQVLEGVIEELWEQ